nr:hypothetical protein [Tanacetum cinerariifolium]
MILSGADNRPPMLDKPLYDSWKSRMELYMLNKEHGRMILESVKHGPLDWPSIEVDGVTRLKNYAELSASEKLQADCDLKDTTSFFKDSPQMSMLLLHTAIHSIHNSLPSHTVSKCLLFYRSSRGLSTTISVAQTEYTISTVNQQTHLVEFPPIDSSQEVLMFKQGDDPIDAINKNDVIYGRQSSFDASTFGTRANISRTKGNNSGQRRVVKCFNCQVLNEEELEFLPDLRVAEGPVTQTIIKHNAAYQVDDLDAYDSDCYDVSTTKEESRSKMLLKQSDLMILEKKVNIKPTNYAELNRLSEDFGKRFIPQQELFDEQAFMLQTSHPNTDQSASSPVKIESPWELPK